MNFKNKTALVTGAAVGIGRASAIKFARCGASLVLLDIDFEKLENVKKELEQYTTDVKIFKCDVSDEKRVFEIAEQVGKVDILVNNAALWRCWSDFLETPAEEWKKFLDINVMGVVYMIKAVLPGMIERGRGRIINVASVAGVYGNANMVHYSATKGALISMTKALAKEVADKGVLVNSVSPGSVSPADNTDVNYTEQSALSFMGDEASYISGQNMQID